MDHRSQAPIVLYDGECGLCARSVRFILDHDRLCIFRFATLQGETGKALLSQYNATPRSVVLIADGQAFQHSTAVLEILKRLRGGWTLLAVAGRLVPEALRDWGYKVIAHHRHRLGGSADHCRLPSAADRERFLD